MMVPKRGARATANRSVDGHNLVPQSQKRCYELRSL